MNKEQAIKAAKEIKERLEFDFGHQDEERTEAGVELYHLMWMIKEMQTSDFSENKAMRWLGYIQGVLVARFPQMYSLQDMKEINRAAVYESIKV